jgi:hypothetical protein
MVGVSTTFAQGDVLEPVIFAGVQDGQLRIFTYDPDFDTLEAASVPTHPAAEEFDNLSWGPDGIVLSLTQRVDPHLELEPSREEMIFAPQLPEHQPYLVETSLSRNLELFFRPQFDAGGFLTYIVRPPEDTIYQDEVFQGVVLDVYKQFYIASQPPLRSGQIVYGYGCGHTPNSPMEALLDAEGSLKSMVAETPYGIVFSPYCVGRGLALSAEGAFTVLHDNLQFVVSAPNPEILAGWDYSTSAIILYDLATEIESVCPVEEEVTQLAWSLDGATLYYATRYPTGEFEFTPSEAEALNAIMPLSETLTMRFGVRLYKMTPATCVSERIYVNANAYAISRIQPTIESLLFSEIENGDAWFDQMLADGQRDLMRESSTRDIVGLNLYHLPIGGDALLIGQGIEKVTVQQ